MIEIWMCHQDPTWTSKLAKHTEEGFWPDQGGLLVGGSYLLVNRDDARRANMVYSDGKVGSPFLRSIFHLLLPRSSLSPSHTDYKKAPYLYPKIVSPFPAAR